MAATIRFEVGQHVRILSPSGSIAATGIISAVNDESSCVSYDVFYDFFDKELFGADEEENNVDPARISPLESFELGVINTLSLGEMKSCGNSLFGKKDFIAASRYYHEAIDKSTKLLEPTLGSNVIVMQHTDLPRGSTCMDGIISDSDVNSSGEEIFEVMLSDQSEITHVLRSQLLPLPQDRDSLVLLRSLYLNLARCDMKRNRKGWTVYNASIAVSISEVIVSDFTDKGSADTDSVDRTEEAKEVRTLLADALYFQAKAFLTAARPLRATKDLCSLRQLDRSQRVGQLATEIDNFRLKRAKDNQRLAKDIAKWVDNVMSGKATVPQRISNRDMDLDEEDDDEAGSTAASAKSDTITRLSTTIAAHKGRTERVTQTESTKVATGEEKVVAQPRQGETAYSGFLPVAITVVVLVVAVLWRFLFQ